jgi:hypothetical protein
VEHKNHAAAVHHVLVVGFLLDSVEELPKADVRSDSEVAFHRELRSWKKEKRVWVDVVWLETIGAKHR